MPLPGFCHDPTGLEILAQARANPGDSLRRLVLADWLDSLGDGIAGEFARLIRESLGTDTVILVEGNLAESLDPLVGFLRGWPHARHLDQADPVAVAWLSTPDVIQLAPGNFIELVRVPLRRKRLLLSKTVITKRQWHAHLRRKLPAGQNPNHPVTGITAEKALAFCESLAAATGLGVRLPDPMEWRAACWNTDDPEKMKRLAKDSDEVDRQGWTRRNTPSGTEYYSRPIRQEVCTRKPNALGLFDMCGLTSEWCQIKWASSTEMLDISSTWIFRGIRGKWCWEAPWTGGIRIIVESE